MSTDGRVLEWHLKKGLEQKTLMSLKRIPNAGLGSNAFRPVEGPEAHHGSFRKAAGMSIDVLDPGSYLVATDDGWVHR